MANQSTQVKSIAIENLLVDLQNPRYDPRSNQREGISTIAHDQGVKLLNLAEDIVDRGLNPSELPMVTTSGDDDTFVIVEGNRRVAAIKLISSPTLLNSINLPEGLTKRYKLLQDQAKDRLPRQINCAVMSREDANHWIFLKHTGENQGVGVVPWDGIQTQRFRGSSPALQAIELVKASNYLDQATRAKLSKIAITNVERVLGTPDARRLLGVDVKSGQLILKAPDEDAIGRLALFVSDVANRNIKVTDLDSKDQRIEYAREVASRPLPKSSITSQATRGQVSNIGANPSGQAGTRRIGSVRNTLIPRQLKLTIPQTRINKIYHELQKLRIDQFINCGAVMFRVFVELSVDAFAQKHKILLKVLPKKINNTSGQQVQPKDMTLREKLTVVADYLEKQSLCSKAELRGIRALISNRDHFLSVDSLNAFVHNKDYNPIATDIKTTWDNVQIFVERIWTV